MITALLAGLLAASFAPAPAAAARTEEFERRLAMISALEETRDRQRLSALISQDPGLASYSAVLRRAAAHLKDPKLVLALLDAPAAIRSPSYAQAAGGVYAYLAANQPAHASSIPGLLLERFRGDRDARDLALRSILAAASSFVPVEPNARLARAVADAGSDLGAAEREVAAEIEADELPHKAERLARLARFVRAVRSVPGTQGSLPR